MVYPKGLSCFRAKTNRPGSGKQNHSLQNLSFAKASIAAGLFLFLRTLLRSQRTLKKISKNSFRKHDSYFLLLVFWLLKKDQSLILINKNLFLHATNHETLYQHNTEM